MKMYSDRRRAGILLHVTSLPGDYGVGDMGREAFRFATQLTQAGQHYWQMLPLNPVEKTKGFSPYSPLSAFAGNTLLINPEELAEKGFIDRVPRLKKCPSGKNADFQHALKVKENIIGYAYDYFTKKGDEKIRSEFDSFCSGEGHWLHDYALFKALKDSTGKPWYEWNDDLRDRKPEALHAAGEKYSYEIMREKYAQFLFAKQWHELKSFCNSKQLYIIGDVPIYISHDSSDIWANPQFWKLGEDKKISGIAGVPPDYFNDKGQLWNMPVYNWHLLKETGYDWWIRRLRKNMELFDMVRLDHFRGFSAFWEVKGGSADAVNGQWNTGPGSDLFDAVKKEFPSMPFIAEDLGDIDQPVFDLRDRYGLPGMKILQFAFDEDMAWSEFIPHNYVKNCVVYTGTHDNNTVKGWFRTEIKKRGKQNLNHFMGKKVKYSGCHKDLIREAYKSVADIVILPIQDVLGCNGKHRMNYPSTEEGNWLWRLEKKQFSKKYVAELLRLTETFGRNAYNSSQKD